MRQGRTRKPCPALPLRELRRRSGATTDQCVVYGLELTDECGTAIGPAAFSSSPSPMHSPELCPVHGMPPISGRPPTGAVLLKSGELGTMSGTQILVNWSSVSPPAHAETDGAELPFVGAANIATAGAAAIATANDAHAAAQAVK